MHLCSVITFLLTSYSESEAVAINRMMMQQLYSLSSRTRNIATDNAAISAGLGRVLAADVRRRVDII